LINDLKLDVKRFYLDTLINQRRNIKFKHRNIEYGMILEIKKEYDSHELVRVRERERERERE